MDNHKEIRNKFKWGTNGKNFDQPLRWITLKDIHDDHLENMIIWVTQRIHSYSPDTLKTLIDEKEYRRLNKIKVPFKFG